MEIGSMIFTGATMPTDIQVDNYNAHHVIETALAESTFIVHEENQQSRASRFNFDSNIKRRYLRRPDEAEDSLRTIRAYNYMNPDTVVMVNIPSDFGINSEVTAKTIKILLEKGVIASTIESIKVMMADIIEYYTAGYEAELSQAMEDKEAELSKLEDEIMIDLTPYGDGKSPKSMPSTLEEELKSELYIRSEEERLKLDTHGLEAMYREKRLDELERKHDTRVARLKKQYLDFPPFPYILMGKDLENCPALRVSKDDISNGSTYYALSTTVPQQVYDLMCKTYMSQCVQYMLGEMDVQFGIKEIGIDTDVYYDYLITENATLYIFLHLQKY